MKSLLIAASLATAMLGIATPAVAQNMRPEVTRTTTTDQTRGDRANDRRVDRRTETTRTTSRNVRHTGWGARRCHNVRRHHRWVRVCNRR
jgi:Ni/Co efflux regulator RcnB